MARIEDVLTANEGFYAAMDRLDIEAMEGLWLHADSVSCIHPGQPVAVGWDEVRSTWARIFENTGAMGIVPAVVAAGASGDAGWVTCFERVTQFYEQGVLSGYVQATNMFASVEGEWRMVVHHASDLPGVLADHAVAVGEPAGV